MKKIVCAVLAIALTLSMVLVFAACNDKEEPQKLICGVTEFDPMSIENTDGTWTGFDSEFAELVGKKLGMEVEFVKITWSQRYSELESGAINCIWNGFTANSQDEDGVARTDKVDMSYSYMLNQQCIVVKASAKADYATEDSLLGKKIAVESGSAGDSYAKGKVGDNGNVIGVAAQINAIPEVKSGAADCAVIDVLLAKSLVGKGDYADLAIADVELPAEVYAVGFKKGSDLKDKVNGAMKELSDEGKLLELAQKYKLENSLQLDTSFPG